jgi:hypothetical protein
MEARKLRRKISTTTTTRPPAWKTALRFVSKTGTQRYNEDDIPSARHNVAVATLYRLLDIHREVVQAINLECIADATQNE